MLRPDDVLGSYRIVRSLGSGATAEVFEARHEALGSRHAIKVLHSQWTQNDAVRARFLQEGRLQANFRHPGLVRVTDTIAEPGVAALVMDFLDGETLRERLDREGHVAPQEAVQWAIQALDALQAAHDQEVVHRDLKPENLFLESTKDGAQIRILDFGVAKDGEGSLTQSSVGTAAYMSPEQVRDSATVAPSSDLFAMGAVLWEALIGRPAFRGPSAFLSMQAVLESKPEAPARVRSELPFWLSDIVEVALRKDPADRFASAAEFADALRAGARGVELPARAGTKPVARSGGPGASWAVGLGLLFALAIGAGIVVIGIVVVMSFAFRPAEIHNVTVTSDPCGNVTVDVDASARKANAEIVIGQSRTILAISGRQTVTATERAGVATWVNVDVTVGLAQQSQMHQVSGTAPKVNFQLPAARGEGAVGRTLVQISGSCATDVLDYEARIDGVVVDSGTVSPGGQFWMETQTLKQGSHGLEVELRDGATVVDVNSSGLGVAPPPPPGDQDQDGHLSISAGGDDCNDLDPAVNPDQDELATPNGVDDNCDGRVDEGTVAYDDDGDGTSEQDGDCNDADKRIHPGARELADCRDQNCDGVVDEGVELPHRDDAYEPNDSRDHPYDLQTGSMRAFQRELRVVPVSVTDEAWFRFYSQDGDFDDWGIDITAMALPAESSVEIEVFDDTGASRSKRVLGTDGEMLGVRGRWLRDDGGIYTVRVRPVTLYAPYCPVELRIESR